MVPMGRYGLKGLKSESDYSNRILIKFSYKNIYFGIWSSYSQYFKSLAQKADLGVPIALFFGPLCTREENNNTKL